MDKKSSRMRKFYLKHLGVQGGKLMRADSPHPCN
jgi:hypothetical protein